MYNSTVIDFPGSTCMVSDIFVIFQPVGNTGISIRHLLQKDGQLDELKDLILKQMKFKKESHYLELGDTGSTTNLSKTGG